MLDLAILAITAAIPVPMATAAGKATYKLCIGFCQKNITSTGGLQVNTRTKNIKNPKNVISAGINASSQINTIIKFKNQNDINKTIFLIPDSDFKEEIEDAISRSKIKLKYTHIYNTDPTKITKQIEKFTYYPQRKQNLIDEIKRLENSTEENKNRKIENLKKRDTLGGINFDSVIVSDFEEGLKSVFTSLLYTDVSPQRIYYITYVFNNSFFF